MKLERDMDFIRDLLLDIEGGLKEFTIDYDPDLSCFNDATALREYKEKQQKLRYHLDLLRQSGIVKFGFVSLSGDYLVESISWSGHDFIDSIRDPEIWSKTKKVANNVGSFSFERMGEIAKGVIKTQILKHSGIDLEI